MANIRIPEKQSDVLITFLQPAQEQAVLADSPGSVVTQVLASFQIHDYGLFG